MLSRLIIQEKLLLCRPLNHEVYDQHSLDPNLQIFMPKSTSYSHIIIYFKAHQSRDLPILLLQMCQPPIVHDLMLEHYCNITKLENYLPI